MNKYPKAEDPEAALRIFRFFYGIFPRRKKVHICRHPAKNHSWTVF